MTDPIAGQHWAVTMAQTVCATGCSCIFCTRRSEVDSQADHTRTTPRSRPRRHTRRSLPSASSIMEVLYSSSYLGTPPAFPDPPSYFMAESSASNAQGDQAECFRRTPRISSTTATERMPPSDHHNPLGEAPSLTGIPSPGAAERAPPAEPNVPVVGLGIGVMEEAGPPPAYSRFDEHRSHLPGGADGLGPYPHVSVLSPSASG